MRTPRFLWPAWAPLDDAGEVFLAPDQARHAVLVLRLAVGAGVDIISQAGLAPALVTTAGGSPPLFAVRVTGPWAAEEGGPGACLAMALIQAGRFDWVVEKSVELGAAVLIPLVTERVKSGDGRPGEARVGRWKRLAEEARKQCGRSSPLDIRPPLMLGELTARAGEFGPALFLSPTAPPGDMLSAAPGQGPPLLAVGPEGGFSPAEEELMLAAGFVPKSLGRLTLRAETAALAALARLL